MPIPLSATSIAMELVASGPGRDLFTFIRVLDRVVDKVEHGLRNRVAVYRNGREVVLYSAFSSNPALTIWYS